MVERAPSRLFKIGRLTPQVTAGMLGVTFCYYAYEEYRRQKREIENSVINANTGANNDDTDTDGEGGNSTFENARQPESEPEDVQRIEISKIIKFGLEKTAKRWLGV